MGVVVELTPWASSSAVAHEECSEASMNGQRWKGQFPQRRRSSRGELPGLTLSPISSAALKLFATG